MTSRTIHRVVSIVLAVFTLYLGVTGSLIESVDFKTLITKPQPFDPDLMAMREDFAGPPNFRVLATADNLGGTLPADKDLPLMLAETLTGARARFADLYPTYVELRVVDGKAVGQLRQDGGEFRFDALRGTDLGRVPPALNEDAPPASLRNTVKHLHRMTTFGNWALWINIVVSIGLATLIVTGLTVYLKLWRVRRKIKRPNPLWKAGGWWRTLHRWISIAAALFLCVTTLSGAWLAMESLVFGLVLERTPRILAVKAASPLATAALPRMLDVTLAAYRAIEPETGVRVIRLRIYGGMPQGVIITAGREARQLVFNADTGASASLTEPGYPAVGFPFGWQAHQLAKSIHRGDFFGITGRVTSLVAGLAMIYLSSSGIVMYYLMWNRRRNGGVPNLFWK